MTHNNTKFWSLFLFRGHSAQEHVSVVCDDKQGELSYFADPHRNLHEPQLTQEKLGER